NLRALWAGLVVEEVPSFEHPRVYGQSNLRAVPDGWRVFKQILRERFRSPIVRDAAAAYGTVGAPIAVVSEHGPANMSALMETIGPAEAPAELYARRDAAGSSAAEPAIVLTRTA